MMKIKKILGILLAVCFLMSVTVGAASANSFEKKSVEIKKVTVVEKEKKFGEEKKFRGDREEHKFRGDREEHRFNEHHKKFHRHHRHFHPGHWEKHKFPHHKEFNHGKWIVIYEYKEVFVKSYWTEDDE